MAGYASQQKLSLVGKSRVGNGEQGSGPFNLDPQVKTCGKGLQSQDDSPKDCELGGDGLSNDPLWTQYRFLMWL